MRDAWKALRRNWWRLVFAAVGAVAAIVSYGHIVNLFLTWHAPLYDARLMPIAIDGLIIIGAGAARSGQVALGWSAIGPGLAASLYANVMNGLPYGKGAAMGSGWATVALFLATNVMERWKPAQVSGVAGGGRRWPDFGVIHPEVEPAAEPEPATLEPVAGQVAGVAGEVAGDGPETASGTDISQDSDPLAGHPPATPGQCGHTVAGTADENVVRAYLHERDCLGGSPTVRQLARDSGLSRHRVAALVAPLNGHGGHGED